MKIALLNSPWYKEINGEKYYFTRAGSRWPHFEKFNPDGLPCYMPYPFFMGITTALLKENGFNILALDGAAEILKEDDFSKKVIDFKPDVCLFEASSISIDYDLKQAEKIKKETKSLIAFAGLHSFMYEAEFLEKYPFIDFVLIGEYEKTFLNLCVRLREKKPLFDMTGIIYKKDEKVVRTGRSELAALDSLPFADRESFPLKNYKDTPGDIPLPSAQIYASRGCPYKCVFCAWPQIIYGGNSYRKRSVFNIIKEIKFLKDNYNIKSVYFDDDTFNIDRKFCADIARAFINEKLNIKWAAMARADLMDEELLILLKKSGLAAVKYGIESASPEILKNMNKNLNLGKAVDMIHKTKGLGIKTHLTFCFGLFGETKKTIKKTVNLALKLNPDSLQFSIAAPFPGSVYYEKLKKEGRLLTDDFSKYDGYNISVVKHENFSADYIQKAVKDAYKKFENKKRLEAKKNKFFSKLKKMFKAES